MYLLDLFEGRVENGQCDLRCVDDRANGSYVDVLFTSSIFC